MQTPEYLLEGLLADVVHDAMTGECGEEDGQPECFTIARAILDAGWRPAADPDDPRPASESPLDDEL